MIPHRAITRMSDNGDLGSTPSADPSPWRSAFGCSIPGCPSAASFVRWVLPPSYLTAPLVRYAASERGDLSETYAKALRVGLRQSGAGANEGECGRNRGRRCPHGISNVCPSSTTPKGQQAVAQGRKHLWPSASSHMVAILTQGHITHMMRGALNRPVPTPQVFQHRCTRLTRGKVGDSAQDRSGGLPRAVDVTLTGSAQRDRCLRSSQIGTIASGAFQAPDFQRRHYRVGQVAPRLLPVPYSSRLSTRTAMVSSRTSPITWSSRLKETGLSDSSAPFSRSIGCSTSTGRGMPTPPA